MEKEKPTPLKWTNKIYKKILQAVDSLPPEAVTTATKEMTRKGYDTTGYQYQFLVNVLNEIVGVNNWSFKYENIHTREGQWSNGRIFYDITVEMTVTIMDQSRVCVGGHRSESYADALKGAITNAFKKTISFFGIGKKAYEGTLDEDYQPVKEEIVKAPTKPVKNDKMQIVNLCHRIDPTTATNKNYKEFVVAMTQLELTEKNYAEIIGRLEILLNK